MTVEDAVRLLAGTLVGVSLVGGLLHSPHWFWLTGFVSVNLIQSAFTGLCPAESIFQAMGLKQGRSETPQELSGPRRRRGKSANRSS